MVRRLLLLVIFTCAITFTYAQKRSDLKGPKAKNYKPWQNKEKPTEVYTLSEEEKLQGPNAKNNRFGQPETDQEHQAINTNTNYRKYENLTGPNAKNYKPGKKEKEVDVTAKK